MLLARLKLTKRFIRFRSECIPLESEKCNHDWSQYKNEQALSIFFNSSDGHFCGRERE